MGVHTVIEGVTMKRQQTEEKEVFTVKPHHTRILTAIFHHHIMTTEQVTRLLYSQNSIADVRKLLRALEQATYLTVRYLHRTTPVGSLPKLYTLDLDGFNYLKKQGLDMPPRFRRLDDKESASTFLPHTLAVNDVLIAAETLQKSFPAIALYGYKHELDLKREKAIVVVIEKRTDEGKGEKETIKVIPDLFLDFRIQQPEREKPYRCCMFIEIDLNTEGQRKIRQKVRAFLEFVKSGECLTRFGTKNPTIGFINFDGGQKRREELQTWAEAELKTTKEPHFWTDMFVFTAAPDKPAIVNGEELYLSPVWYTPFSTKPTMMISAGSRM